MLLALIVLVLFLAMRTTNPDAPVIAAGNPGPKANTEQPSPPPEPEKPTPDLEAEKRQRELEEKREAARKVEEERQRQAEAEAVRQKDEERRKNAWLTLIRLKGKLADAEKELESSIQEVKMSREKLKAALAREAFPPKVYIAPAPNVGAGLSPVESSQERIRLLKISEADAKRAADKLAEIKAAIMLARVDACKMVVQRGDLQIGVSTICDKVALKNLGQDSVSKNELLMVVISLFHTNPTKKIEYRSWANRGIVPNPDCIS